MTYTGRVKQGVIVLDGPEHPPEGTVVRVEEQPRKAVGQALEKLAGKAKGLPSDLAQRHDQYRRERQ